MLPPTHLASIPRFGSSLTNPACTTLTGIAKRHKDPPPPPVYWNKIN